MSIVIPGQLLDLEIKENKESVLPCLCVPVFDDFICKALQTLPLKLQLTPQQINLYF